MSMIDFLNSQSCIKKATKEFQYVSIEKLLDYIEKNRYSNKAYPHNSFVNFRNLNFDFKIKSDRLVLIISKKEDGMETAVALNKGIKNKELHHRTLYIRQCKALSNEPVYINYDSSIFGNEPLDWQGH